MPSKIITEDDKNKVVEYYLESPKTISNVAKHFNYSNPTIIKILNERKIERWKKAQINNPSLQENFFENIDSEYKAYFLGLIISDGNVFKTNEGNRQFSISITLQEEDKYLLEEFKTCVNANTNINSDGRGCYYFAIRSDKMAKDLESLGIVPRKSYHTYLPNIPQEFLPHLIRGIFDGDGSFQAKQTDRRFLHNLSFCGSHQLMEDLAKLFNDLGTKTEVKVYDYKDRKLSEIKLQSYYDIVLIGDWFYKDSTIYMKRKRDKFNLIKDKAHGNTEITF